MNGYAGHYDSMASLSKSVSSAGDGMGGAKSVSVQAGALTGSFNLAAAHLTQEMEHLSRQCTAMGAAIMNAKNTYGRVDQSVVDSLPKPQ